MHVTEIRNENDWNNFLCQCPKATFYHTPEWKKILEQSFPLKLRCFAIENNGRIVGLFPTAISKGFLTTTMNSLPFSDYGGPIVQEECKKEALSCLAQFLREESEREGISWSQVAFFEKDAVDYFAQESNCTVDESVGDVLLDLYAKPLQRIWNKEFKKHAGHGPRNYINRIDKDGFHVIEAENRSDLQRFYELYHKNIQYIGGKPFPYKFFENAWLEHRSGRFAVLLVQRGSSFLGGLGFLFFKNENAVYLNYVGLDRRSLGSRYQMGTYLFWSGTKWASERNIRYVHLGLTPNDESSYYYKQKMGFGGIFIPQYRLVTPYNYGIYRIREKGTCILGALADRLPSTIKRAAKRFINPL